MLFDAERLLGVRVHIVRLSRKNVLFVQRSLGVRVHIVRLSRKKCVVWCRDSQAFGPILLGGSTLEKNVLFVVVETIGR